MVKESVVLLVVLTSSNSCKLDNIIYAEPTVSKMESMEKCEEMANSLNGNLVGAFCIDASDY